MASIDDILTLAEAADRLGISANTLRNQMKRGRIRGRLIGKTYVTTVDEVERYRRQSLGNPGRPLRWRDRDIFMTFDGIGERPDTWLQRFGRIVHQSTDSNDTPPRLVERLAPIADEIGAVVEWREDPNGTWISLEFKPKGR